MKESLPLDIAVVCPDWMQFYCSGMVLGAIFASLIWGILFLCRKDIE